MEFMVLAISALVFFVVSSIGYNKGKEDDAKERKIEYISGKKKVQNEKEGEKSSKRFLSSQIQALNNMANRSAANVKKNAKYKLVEKQLRLAGLSISPENFVLQKSDYGFNNSCECIYSYNYKDDISYINWIINSFVNSKFIFE